MYLVLECTEVILGSGQTAVKGSCTETEYSVIRG